MSTNATTEYAAMEAAIFKYIDTMSDEMVCGRETPEGFLDHAYEVVHMAFAIAMGRYQKGMDREQ